MAEDFQVQRAKILIGWPYPDTEPIRLALTAGDTEGANREGNRRLAQVGDRLIPFIITLMCYRLGVSRQDENTTQIKIQDKRECARRARICRLDTLIKTSVRQMHEGPQPTVLKNAMYALISAVWMQAQDWPLTISAMVNLGLVGRSERVSPYLLMTSPSAPTSVLDAVMPYLPVTAEDDASTDTRFGSASASNADNESCDRRHHPAASGVLAESSEFISASESAMPSSVPLHDYWTCDSPPMCAHDPSKNGYHAYDQCTSTDVAYPCDLPCHLDAESYHDYTMPIDDGTYLVNSGATHHDNPSSRLPISVIPEYTSTIPVGRDDATQQRTQNTYDEALSASLPPYYGTFMQLVSCIGTPLAVLSLKLLLENLRELQLGRNGKKNATRIGAEHSNADRIAAIDDLTVSLAHFTLPLRMHIYMLYKNAESEHPEQVKGRDSFVLEMGLPSTRTRGRPENIRKAYISKKMSAPGRDPSQAKRWRRMGQRLGLLVDSFGIGILGLLDERLTIEMIIKSPDPVFKSFITVIKDVEGDRLRYMCETAGAIVDLLFDKSGNSYNTRFRIEDCSEDFFESSERCSPVLAMLLLQNTHNHDMSNA